MNSTIVSCIKASFVTPQGPKVSDEKLREMCSAVVEGTWLDLLQLHPFIISNLEGGQTEAEACSK